MNIKFKINKDTLQVVCDDPTVEVFIEDLGEEIEVEVSKPDPEVEIK